MMHHLRHLLCRYWKADVETRMMIHPTFYQMLLKWIEIIEHWNLAISLCFKVHPCIFHVVSMEEVLCCLWRVVTSSHFSITLRWTWIQVLPSRRLATTPTLGPIVQPWRQTTPLLVLQLTHLYKTSWLPETPTQRRALSHQPKFRYSSAEKEMRFYDYLFSYRPTLEPRIKAFQVNNQMPYCQNILFSDYNSRTIILQGWVSDVCMNVGCMYVTVPFSRWDNLSTMQAEGLGFFVGTYYVNLF